MTTKKAQTVTVDSDFAALPLYASALRSVPPSAGQLAIQPPPDSKVPQPAAQIADSLLWGIPWFHHIVLLEKVKDMAIRHWYMEQTLINGWSRSILIFEELQAELGESLKRSKASQAKTKTSGRSKQRVNK